MREVARSAGGSDKFDASKSLLLEEKVALGAG